MNHEKIQKPFLKWVGGKTQILPSILSKIPKEMNNYHELFLGGGSVLFAVLSLQKQQQIKIRNKIYASDINHALINLYKHIQTDKEKLYEYIDFYIREYDGIEGTEIHRNPSTIKEAKTSKESYYYWIRKKYNKMSFANTQTQNTPNTVTRDRGEKASEKLIALECSALFMFLNKTCFRGMYREGKYGFNVPYGHYKKTPTIISREDLFSISDLIQNVEFKQQNFKDSIKNVKRGDFVYIDPPYAPENRNSFVEYVADGFHLKDHELLFREIKKLNGISFIMSNAKVPLVTDNFKEFHCQDIVARRAINPKKPGSTTMEVLIYYNDNKTC